MLNLIIIAGIEINIIQFHITQLLLTVLNKNKLILGENKGKSSRWYKYLFKRYPLRHSNIHKPMCLQSYHFVDKVSKTIVLFTWMCIK